jgi:hypothetical protein
VLPLYRLCHIYIYISFVLPLYRLCYLYIACVTYIYIVCVTFISLVSHLYIACVTFILHVRTVSLTFPPFFLTWVNPIPRLTKDPPPFYIHLRQYILSVRHCGSSNDVLFFADIGGNRAADYVLFVADFGAHCAAGDCNGGGRLPPGPLRVDAPPPQRQERPPTRPHAKCNTRYYYTMIIITIIVTIIITTILIMQ